jgi:hypothetical protein
MIDTTPISFKITPSQLKTSILQTYRTILQLLHKDKDVAAVIWRKSLDGQLDQELPTIVDKILDYRGGQVATSLN